jgi:RNA recognition motif-containing protein
LLTCHSLFAGKEEEGELANSNENASQTGAADEDPDARSVFVKNVDYAADEAQLIEHFKLCGEIARVTIRKDHRTSQPLG